MTTSSGIHKRKIVSPNKEILLKLFWRKEYNHTSFQPREMVWGWCYKPRNTNVNGTYVNYCLDAPGKGMRGWVTHIYVRI